MSIHVITYYFSSLFLSRYVDDIYRDHHRKSVSYAILFCLTKHTHTEYIEMVGIFTIINDHDSTHHCIVCSLSITMRNNQTYIITLFIVGWGWGGGGGYYKPRNRFLYIWCLFYFQINLQRFVSCYLRFLYPQKINSLISSDEHLQTAV